MKLTEAELREHLAADLPLGEVRRRAGDRRRAQAAVRRQQGDVRRHDGQGPAHPADAGAWTTPRPWPRPRQQLQTVKQQIEGKVAAGMAKLPANADALAREKARTP